MFLINRCQEKKNKGVEKTKLNLSEEVNWQNLLLTYDSEHNVVYCYFVAYPKVFDLLFYLPLLYIMYS